MAPIMLSLTALGPLVRPTQGETPPAPEPVRYVDPATVGPGFIGFVLFMFLVVAVFVLWRSMNKQLAKIDFEEPEDAPRPANAPFGPNDGPVSGEGVSP